MPLSSRRIRHVNISEGVLPAQPLVELRYRTEIEDTSVFTHVVQIRVEIQFLGDHRAGMYFVHEFFAQTCRGEIARADRGLCSHS